VSESTRVAKMFRSMLFTVALGIAGLARAAQPIIDNERVVVWDAGTPLPPAQHDFVAVPLLNPGTAVYGHKGEIPATAGARTIVIELKDHPVAPIANTSGYPNAFPRPRVVKLFENDRVIVWSYRWNPGEPTPMHFHDKDVVVVYQEETALKSTTPSGNSVLNQYRSGEVRFNRRDRTHTETLVGASGSAVMTELK
jgi:hypothetical protein